MRNFVDVMLFRVWLHLAAQLGHCDVLCDEVAKLYIYIYQRAEQLYSQVNGDSFSKCFATPASQMPMRERHSTSPFQIQTQDNRKVATRAPTAMRESHNIATHHPMEAFAMSHAPRRCAKLMTSQSVIQLR